MKFIRATCFLQTKCSAGAEGKCFCILSRKLSSDFFGGSYLRSGTFSIIKNRPTIENHGKT